MARIARVVIPGLPHLVTQRGAVFSGEADYGLYKRFLGEETAKRGVMILGWCLMPDHCHLILVPADARGLALAMGRLQWRYARQFNARAGRSGPLFPARYSSVVMDDSHFRAALAYVDGNPLRARLVRRAEDWPWSSARGHLGLGNDDLVAAPLPPGLAADHAATLSLHENWPETTALRRAEIIGRPVGSASFVAEVETRLKRKLAPGRRGRPRLAVAA